MTPTPSETVMSNVLILEPDSHQAAQLLEELARRGIRGTVAVSDTQATSRIERIRWNLIFVAESFLTLYSHAAESILRTIRTSNPEAPLVLVASEDSSPQGIGGSAKGVCRISGQACGSPQGRRGAGLLCSGPPVCGDGLYLSGRHRGLHRRA